MSTRINTLLGHASTRVGTAALCLAVAGCESYPERTERAFHAFERGDFEQAGTLYEDRETTRSEFLSGAEAGSVALAAGDWETTLEQLGRASNASEEIENAALISLDSFGESLVSFAVSERLSEYVGEGYERVMLHAQMGMAYLAQGLFESARVEVKRANALLESEEALYEKEYAAGGLGHLLSAIVYELEGSPDEAYIDYKRMYEKGLGGRLVGRSLVRLATLLGRDDELPEWESRFGADAVRPVGAAEIVVIAGVGLGPYKVENTISVPTGNGLLQWSVPRYRSRSGGANGVELVVEGSGQAIGSVVVEDISTVASENLEDRIAWLAVRSGVRAVMKQQLTQHLDDQWDGAGFLLGTLFTATTERADLRAWQTLPDTFQAARVFLAPGIHTLTLRAVGGEAQTLGDVELVAGETLFVFARTVGSRLYAHPIGGRFVEPDSLDPELDTPEPEPSPEPVLEG